MSNSVFVELREAQIGYEHRPILEGVNLKLTEGDFLGLVGPNGAGKTTLLKALLGNLPLLSGVRKVRAEVPPRFGYVPQREALDRVFPLKVREVVGMGRFPHRGLFQRFSSEDRERIDWSVSKAGIEPLAEKLYRDLSGGQKQRALIARALATEPEILVLDEPTAGMDLRSSKDLLDLIANLHDEGHLTVVLVTHLLGEVANCAHSIALVEKGRCQVGPTEHILTSESLSAMYEIPVAVGTVAGQRVIVVPDVAASDAPGGANA